jgi:hypothetical protein
MSTVINLKRYRKQKAKAARNTRAEINRRLHGRTKAEVAREELLKRRLARSVDGAKLGPGGREGSDDMEAESAPAPCVSLGLLEDIDETRE